MDHLTLVSEKEGDGADATIDERRGLAASGNAARRAQPVCKLMRRTCDMQIKSDQW